MVDLQDKQLIFIIGAPRSGTTWLQALVGSHPSVATTVQMGVFNYYLAQWLEEWNRQVGYREEGDWDDGLPYVLTEAEFYGFMQAFTDQIYQKIADKNPLATHILDKHPEYTRHIATINRMYPKALFIHIIRDGRDQVSSHIAAQRNMGWGPRTVSEATEAWRDYILMARQAAQYDGLYHELRYEALLEAPQQTMQALFDFCGLHISEGALSKIINEHHFDKMKAKRQAGSFGSKIQQGHYRKGQKGSWESEFSALDRYTFDKYAGKLLLDLGYANKNWWAESDIQAHLIPQISRSRTLLLRVNNKLQKSIVKYFAD